MGCGALPAADDRARVAHAPAGRRGLSGDEANHRLLHVLLDELRRRLFSRAADLANHDDGFCLGIIVEHAQCIDMRGADDRVAADADAGRLADAALRQLIYSLISQCPGAGDDADRSLFVNAARHDAYLGLAGRDDAGTVGTEQPRLRVLELGPHLDHVERWNALGDANDQRNPRVLRFENRVGGKRRRNKNHRHIGAGLLHGVCHGIEHRPAFMCRPALAGSYSANNFGAVLRAAHGMESAFLARNSLNNESSFFVDKYSH